MPKKLNGIEWDWVKSQYELGFEAPRIAEAYREAFGVKINPATIRVKAHRDGWSRYAPQHRAGRGETVLETAVDSNSGVFEVVDETEEGDGGNRGEVKPLLPTREARLARADARLAAIEADHERRSTRLKDDADSLLLAVSARLRNPASLKTSEIRDLAQALEKAASIQQRAIEQERKLFGLDKDQTASGVAPVTQIAIICNGVQGIADTTGFT